MKEIRKVVKKLSRQQDSAAAGAGAAAAYEPVQKHKVTPSRYTAMTWLVNTWCTEFIYISKIYLHFQSFIEMETDAELFLKI